MIGRRIEIELNKIKCKKRKTQMRKEVEVEVEKMINCTIFEENLPVQNIYIFFENISLA